MNKSNKELDRLKNLYSNSDQESQKKDNQPDDSKTEDTSDSLVTPKQAPKHQIVKKDLGFLIILIVVMLVLLFGLNYLAANSGLGDWINQAFSGIF